MRTVTLSIWMLLTPALAFAQEHGSAAAAEESSPLMALRLNLMLWTLVIFVALFVILKRYAFPAILGAVEKREQSLQAALESARRDREEAQKLLEEQRRQLEGARGEAQKYIAEGRALAEKMRHDLLEQTRQEQQTMLDRARQEIQAEKERAVAQLRREAVSLAIAGASKVIEQNLDNNKNRQLVESFLASIPAMPGRGGGEAQGSR